MMTPKCRVMTPNLNAVRDLMLYFLGCCHACIRCGDARGAADYAEHLARLAKLRFPELQDVA